MPFPGRLRVGELQGEWSLVGETLHFEDCALATLPDSLYYLVLERWVLPLYRDRLLHAAFGLFVWHQLLDFLVWADRFVLVDQGAQDNVTVDPLERLLEGIDPINERLWQVLPLNIIVADQAQRHSDVLGLVKLVLEDELSIVDFSDRLVCKKRLVALLLGDLQRGFTVVEWSRNLGQVAVYLWPRWFSRKDHADLLLFFLEFICDLVLLLVVYLSNDFPEFLVILEMIRLGVVRDSGGET